MDQVFQEETTVLPVFKERVQLPAEFYTISLSIKWSKTRKVYPKGT